MPGAARSWSARVPCSRTACRARSPTWPARSPVAATSSWGRPPTAPAASVTSSAWARCPGCGRAARAGSRHSTPRPLAMKTTSSPGRRSNPPPTTAPRPCSRSPWVPALADNPLLPPSPPRTLKPAVLAIDGGNSKTDVALVASDGTLLASARGPGINAHDVGVDQTVLILDAVVKQAAAQLSGRYRADGRGWVAMHTVACLANADLPEEEAEHAAAVQAQGWSPTATVVNDTFAILRSGLADRAEPHWGVAVVCGAGINAVR